MALHVDESIPAIDRYEVLVEETEPKLDAGDDGVEYEIPRWVVIAQHEDGRRWEFEHGGRICYYNEARAKEDAGKAMAAIKHGHYPEISAGWRETYPAINSKAWVEAELRRWADERYANDQGAKE